MKVVTVNHININMKGNKKMAEKKAARKPKQEEIPLEGKGVAPVKIPKVDKLARQYVEDRDKRLAALTDEVSSKGKLIEAIHFHAEQLKQPDGTLVYRYDDQELRLEPGKEKLSIKTWEDTEVVDKS
jgi:hypothetical protein